MVRNRCAFGWCRCLSPRIMRSSSQKILSSRGSPGRGEIKSAREVGLQPLQHDHVRSKQQECLGIVFGNSSCSRTAFRNYQAIASDMTLVFPLPVAIFTQ